MIRDENLYYLVGLMVYNPGGLGRKRPGVAKLQLGVRAVQE